MNSGRAHQAKAAALRCPWRPWIRPLWTEGIGCSRQFSMEPQPPFGEFQRPRVLDSTESRQTKTLAYHWISLFMARLKELDSFYTTRRNLSRGSGSTSSTRKPPRRPPTTGKGDQGKSAANGGTAAPAQNGNCPRRACIALAESGPPHPLTSASGPFFAFISRAPSAYLCTLPMPRTPPMLPRSPVAFTTGVLQKVIPAPVHCLCEPSS